jgi:DNA end-binding protein Ku
MAATVWKGYLTFGLVSIPVKAYRAGRAEKINFRQLYREASPPRAGGAGPIPIRDFAEAKAPEPMVPRRAETDPESEEETPVARIQQKAWNEAADRPVDPEDIVKGYEYAKDRYVVVEKEDLRKLTIPTSRELEILATVPLSEIDPVYFETSYYLVPDRGGEKAYSMLYEAMRQTGYAALGKLAMHGREHVVILRPGPTGILMHTMFYQDELRKEQEYSADPALVTPRELDLARTFLEALKTPFEPEKYKDAYRERLQELIDAKLQGRDISRAEPPPSAPPVLDIVEALKQSLAARKPPSSAPARKAPARKKRASS